MIKEIALASIVSFGHSHVDLVDPFDASYRCGIIQNRFSRVIEVSVKYELSPDFIYKNSKSVRDVVSIWLECKARGYIDP